MENLSQFETDLWSAADNLRANSKLTSSDYFMPVLGIIFLRHAANRFDAATRQISADQASGKMPKRKIQATDYIRRRALFLPDAARYDGIMERASYDPAGLPKLVTDAMTAIEADFDPLLGVLPKDYGIFEPKVLEELMRLFNSEQIKHATGDVFGRIYEYFLAKFSIQKAHDNRLIKQLDEARRVAVEQLKHASYFHRRIVWLQDRFPKAEMQPVPGLCKVVTRKEIAAVDWSLTPGRYVGVAAAEVD